MSFSATCWAWSVDNLKSSEKLTLLAFCHFANEEKKIAYPSIETVAEYSGLNRKTVQANIKKLEEKNLLVDTKKRVGPTQSCRVFHVPFLTYKELLEANPKTGMLESEAIPKTDISDPKNGHEAIPKTGSKPVKEPVSNKAYGKPKVSPKAVMALWNDKFKEDYPRKMLELSTARQKVINARIKNDFKTIDEWTEFFDLLKNSNFLMGRTDRPFQMSLDWVCKQENFLKILEGSYHRE